MIHFHRFGNWEDVKVEDRADGAPMGIPVIVIRKVITQQRRCSICNLVKTRYSA